jgi:hypothetical protein
MHVYDTGTGWRWIAEAKTWGYFVEVAELNAGAVAPEQLAAGDVIRLVGRVTEGEQSVHTVFELDILSETSAIARYAKPDEGFLLGPAVIPIAYTVTETSKATLAYGNGDPDFSGELTLDFVFKATGSFAGIAREEAVEYGFAGLYAIQLKNPDHAAATWKILSPNNCYNVGGGWRWLVESELWVYEAPQPLPASMAFVEGGSLATSNELNGTGVHTFYIGRYEVTWGEWQVVRRWAADNFYDIENRGDGCADDHPVHSVSWFDVLKWCNARSEMEGLTPVYTLNGETYQRTEPNHTAIVQNLSANGYRLPLEAEWEFAARGGLQSNGYSYAGSNFLNDVGWFWDNSSGAACNLSSGQGTWPVGQKTPNELGLHDMSGNVLEWCWDQMGPFRHVRGGYWLSFSETCTVSFRDNYYPDTRYHFFGFRLAQTYSP